MSKQDYAKAKGRAWENLCVDALNSYGWNTERRRLQGVNDKGDIAGVPGVVIECKAEKTYKLPQWMREAQTEKANASALLGVVWAKQNGKASAEEGFVIMRPAEFLYLLTMAGLVK